MLRHVRVGSVLLSSRKPLVSGVTIQTMRCATESRQGGKETPRSFVHDENPVVSDTRREYGKVGYDFIENMRTSSASLNSSQNTIIIVSVVLGCLLVYLVYYFTTKRYVLTTNPSPFKNSKFQHFPCDLAVIENKWTHRRYTVELTPNEEERRPDGSYPYRDQVLHINSLKDRVSLYLQKVKSSTLVEVANEMKPDRFIDRTGSVVPRWSETNGSRPSPPMEVPRLFVESIVRPRDVRNGYQLGQLPVYEQTIQTVVRERVVERYKRCVMARCQPGTRPTFVKEYMKNGTVDGSGVTWGEIVPDLTTFTEEVFNEVKKRMGDDVFIYQYGISALKNKP